MDTIFSDYQVARTICREVDAARSRNVPHPDECRYDFARSSCHGFESYIRTQQSEGFPHLQHARAVVAKGNAGGEIFQQAEAYCRGFESVSKEWGEACVARGVGEYANPSPLQLDAMDGVESASSVRASEPLSAAPRRRHLDAMDRIESAPSVSPSKLLSRRLAARVSLPEAMDLEDPYAKGKRRPLPGMELPPTPTPTPPPIATHHRSVLGKRARDAEPMQIDDPRKSARCRSPEPPTPPTPSTPSTLPSPLTPPPPLTL